MSLATRCTSCGTVFRVVQDQLKVSEGWVRCGRCNAVFNALEGLFDLERGAPPGASTEAADATMSASAESESERVDGSVVEELRNPAGLAHVDLDLPAMSVHDNGQESTPAGRVNERDRLEFPDARFDSDMLAEDAIQVRPAGLELESVAIAAREGGTAEGDMQPDFIRHAQRRERWRSPAMRGVQVGVTLVLIGLLALQLTHHNRNLLASRWPATAPALANWCAIVGCRLEAPARIEDVAVESTALTMSSLPGAFKLAVVLRNRGLGAVAMPSIDLALTDVGGQLVARRVLGPQDFRIATPLMPGTESTLQTMIAPGGTNVTGYTVELFYP